MNHRNRFSARMKLSTKFILFIVVIHTLTIVLSFVVFQQNKLLFLGAEFFILISLLISWSLYQELIRPLQLLTQGMDAIRDRDFNVKFVKTGKYEVDKLVEVYNALIDQLRTERTLQQEQHFFLEKLVETAPTGIVLLDYDGNITGINPRALQWAGLDREGKSLVGQPVSQMEHPIFRTMAGMKNGASQTLSMPDARTFKIQKSQFIDLGFPRSFVMIEELTSEILEAEKRSYGKVIRMMAHEVNNSIGAVNSILDTTLHLHTGAPEVRDALAVAIERNDHLNQFMRNFADVIRLPQPRKETFDVNTLLKKVAQLMEFNARERAVVYEWQLSETPVMINADAGQLEQVLINVVKNALESIQSGGHIEWSTQQNPPQLTVTDTGKGIPAELEDKLFSPFFSNKSGGQGIGLTLAREILTAHGFPFSLKTGADQRTRFQITFT